MTEETAKAETSAPAGASAGEKFFLSAAVIFGAAAGPSAALYGVMAAIPRPMPFVMKAALVFLPAFTTYLSAVCAAEAWEMRNPDRSRQERAYVRNLTGAVVLAGALMCGLAGYQFIDKIIQPFAEEARPCLSGKMPVPLQPK